MPAGLEVDLSRLGEMMMDDSMQRVRRWASHGNLRQFYAELGARLAKEGYEIEIEGDTLTVYGVEKQGGFLGLGGRKIRQPKLKVVQHNDSVEVPEEDADPEFVALLAERLRSHH
jgi:hypothetical protein